MTDKPQPASAVLAGDAKSPATSAANGKELSTRKAAPPAPEIITEINRKHALIWVNGQLRVMWTEEIEDGLPRFSSIPDMKNYYKTRKVGKANAFDKWLENKGRREFDRMVFRPGIYATGKDYNLWRDWGVRPDPHGDCTLILEHLHEVICGGDGNASDYLLQWIANGVQTPDAKPGTAIALQGGQGSGKGALLRYLGPIFGAHLLRVAGSDQLLDRWNDSLAGKLFVWGDEAAWPGDKKGVDKLKSWITEEKITVERKWVSKFEIDNYARFIFATNRDHAAPAEMDDRRFVPLNVSDAHIGDRRYWDQLHAEQMAGGPAALLHHLLNVVVLDRDLRQTPKTLALAQQKLLSLDDVGRFLRELLLLESHVIMGPIDRPRLKWGEATTPQALHKFYLDHCQRNGGVRYSKSIDALGTAMRKYITIVRREARRDERDLLNLGDSRARVYALPGLAEARLQFERAHGQPLPWPEDDDDPAPVSDDRFIDEYPPLRKVDEYE